MKILFLGQIQGKPTPLAGAGIEADISALTSYHLSSQIEADPEALLVPDGLAPVEAAKDGPLFSLRDAGAIVLYLNGAEQLELPDGEGDLAPLRGVFQGVVYEVVKGFRSPLLIKPGLGKGGSAVRESPLSLALCCPWIRTASSSRWDGPWTCGSMAKMPASRRTLH